MLKEIILKEIRGHIYSLRFMLTHLLLVILMIISAFIFVGKYHQNMNDFRENLNENNSQLSKAAQKLCDVAFQEQILQIKPSVSELISEGGLKQLPNTFRMTAFQIQLPETIKRSNLMLPEFVDIDWTFIISVIVSFFSMLLVYDAVSGEKIAGTLRLLQSNSISRTTVILGKYIGALSAILIPLIFSVFINLLIVTLFGHIKFAAVHLVQILLFVIAVCLYVSIFIFIGLFVSSRTNNPVTSIIYLLLIWIILVILIPNSGGTIATKIFPIPTWKEVDRQIRHRGSEIGDAHRARYAQTFRWDGNPWAEWVPYRSRAVNEMAQARNSMMHEYMYQMIGQIEKAKLVTQISPASVFFNISELIANTGIQRFRKFYKQVYEYRLQFSQFIVDRDKDDPDSPHLLNEWHKVTISQKPISFSELPQFEEKLVGKNFSQKAILGFGILMLFTMLFFAAAYVSFLRYDVR